MKYSTQKVDNFYSNLLSYLLEIFFHLLNHNKIQINDYNANLLNNKKA